jgi:hypothetical protein
MEWDVGLPWYRPTRINHLSSGAECGWRSGWAVWPDYFYDSLPAVTETGRGSPTGVAFYNHVMFPRRYHDALFVGDWGSGRILAVRMRPQAGTYVAEVETFVEGRPLNITDLVVGPTGVTLLHGWPRHRSAAFTAWSGTAGSARDDRSGPRHRRRHSASAARRAWSGSDAPWCSSSSARTEPALPAIAENAGLRPEQRLRRSI